MNRQASDIGQAAPARGLALWRILVWLLLLFSALGCLQYFHHAQQVWQQLLATAPADAEARPALHGMLAWDIAYLFAALALFAICAGCILRQAWARPALQVAALLLVAWLIASGVMLWMQLNALDHANALPPSLAQGNTSLAQELALIQGSYRLIRRNIELALLFKALAAPFLLWLAWRLGQPRVRAQFQSRR